MPIDYDELLDEGVRIVLEDQDLERALALFSQLIETEPHDLRAYVNRGNIRMDQGLHDESLADYNRAIELEKNASFHPVEPNTNLVNAYAGRGMVLLRMKRPEESLASLFIACDLNPLDDDIYSTIGVVMGWGGRWPEFLRLVVTKSDFGLPGVVRFYELFRQEFGLAQGQSYDLPELLNHTYTEGESRLWQIKSAEELDKLALSSTPFVISEHFLKWFSRRTLFQSKQSEGLRLVKLANAGRVDRGIPRQLNVPGAPQDN